jgi:integrase
MDKQIEDFNALISNASNYLEFRLLLSSATVEQYRQRWRRLRNFMALHDIKSFDNELECKLLKYHFNGRSIPELNKAEKYFYRSVRALSEFMETGEIRSTPILARKEPLAFSGSIGLLVLKFIEYKEMEVRLSANRISCYRRNLHKFLLYCQQKQITSIKNVELADILQFVREPSSKKCNDICKLISTLRVFFKYLYDESILKLDYSTKIPQYKRIAQPQIPSTYSIDEIENLLSSVSRSSSLGKRNYAIILLMVGLDIRALDVCRLKFENIHWYTSTIEFE